MQTSIGRKAGFKLFISIIIHPAFNKFSFLVSYKPFIGISNIENSLFLRFWRFINNYKMIFIPVKYGGSILYYFFQLFNIHFCTDTVKADCFRGFANVLAEIGQKRSNSVRLQLPGSGQGFIYGFARHESCSSTPHKPQSGRVIA